MLHDLRRSFASGLQRLGVAPHIVELALDCDQLTNDFLGWTCDECRIRGDDIERLEARANFLKKRFGK